jgi:hypothetical protein
MQGMSERAYAAHAGVSRGAIQKAKASGRLVLFKDGSIDATASDARRDALTDPAKSRRSDPDMAAPAGSTTPPRGTRAVPPAAFEAASETLREGGHAAPPSANATTYAQAKTANELLKAQERKLKLQALKGELVDRDRATGLAFRMARQERDAWVNWPARVAALMAADLGVEPGAMQSVLERHVREHLASLAQPRLDLG